MELNHLWSEKYKGVEFPDEKKGEVLIGFNTDIDLITHLDKHVLAEFLDDLNEEITRKKMRDPPSKINMEEDFAASFLASMDKGVANEVDVGNKKTSERIKKFFNFDDREIGGQAGISANFLSDFSSVILYTPFVPEEQRKYFRDKILYPTTEEGSLVLRNIKDIENTDKTKKNMIFEYKEGLENKLFDVEADESGRFILSDYMVGYEPLFPKKIGKNLPLMTEDTDRVFLSGYQDLGGKNFHSRLSKAREQIKNIKAHNNKVRIHLEFVSERNKDLEYAILDQIAREVHSIGCDRFELGQILDLLNEKELSNEIEESDFSLIKVFQAARRIMRTLHVERIHLHTKKFLFTIVKQDYEVPIEKIRDSLLFGGYAAVVKALKGEIPTKEDMEGDYDCYISGEGILEMKEFKETLDLDSEFMEEGVQEFKEWKIAVVPTLIAEESEEIVGLGDVTSSGSFVAEIW